MLLYVSISLNLSLLLPPPTPAPIMIATLPRSPLTQNTTGL